jgi:hypothetical protein
MNALGLLYVPSDDSRALMKSIHLICHHTKLGWNNLNPVIGRPGVFISKCWILKDGDPYSLKGGWLYFHEKFSQRAGFAARILAVESCLTGSTRAGVAFTIMRIAQNGQPWRGETPSQFQHHGGIVDANFADEVASVGSLQNELRTPEGGAKS